MFENGFRRLETKYRNGLSYLFGRRCITPPGQEAFVSFTFDDFPHSALSAGGAILSELGVRGTFFASLGMMGQNTSSGEGFTRDDLRDLIVNGHEIGSHTFDHSHPWRSPVTVFEDSIRRNQRELDKIVPGYELRTLAYPYVNPRPRIKRVAARYFSCCRGGGDAPNIGLIDLNLLKSSFIDSKTRDDMNYFTGLLELNARKNGWLIFTTHDVSPTPSAYGCTPALFEKIVRAAVSSAATVLPVSEVLTRIDH